MNIVHLHLFLNHIPVVGSLVAVVLFAAAFFLKETVSTKFALAFTAVIAAVAIVVYLTGGAAEDAVEKLAGVTERAIDRHEEAAEVTTIAMGVLGSLCALAFVMVRSMRAPRWLALAGLAGSLAVSGLMAWTANLGGQIRHTEIHTTTSEAAAEAED
jgi:drug/metabolite transporter (DMT)-like permease